MTVTVAGAVERPEPVVGRATRWAVIPLAVVIGIAAVATPDALLLAGALALAITFVVAAHGSPRAGMVIVLFLLVGYVPDALGAKAHLPVTAQALVGVIALVVLARSELRARLWSLGPELAAFSALLVTMLLSTAVASSRGVAMSRVADQVKDIVIVVLVIALIDSARWLRRAMLAYAVAGVVLAALTIAEQITHAYGSDFGGFAVTLPYQSVYRSAGPLSSNFFAQMLVLSIVFLGYGLMTLPRRRRVAAIAGALVCLGAIGYTYSRGALIALLAALVAVAVARRWGLRLVVAVAIAAVLGLALLPPDFRERLSALSRPTATDAIDTSTRGRLSENIAALQMFAYHPLVGVGPANFDVHYLDYSQHIGLDNRTAARQPHNLYLEVLSERGVIGFLAFAWVMGFAAVGAWRARRSRDPDVADLAECALVALVVVAAGGLFLHAAYGRYIWIAIALAFAVRRIAAGAAVTAARP